MLSYVIALVSKASASNENREIEAFLQSAAIAIKASAKIICKCDASSNAALFPLMFSKGFVLLSIPSLLTTMRLQASILRIFFESSPSISLLIKWPYVSVHLGTLKIWTRRTAQSI